MSRAWTIVLLCISCQKASDTDATKQRPNLPPPPHAQLPDTLKISVEIDGQEAPAIDAARLRAIKPDFEDEEHRAWRLPSLLGPQVARPHAVAEVSGVGAVSVKFREPSAPGQPEPVLAETRRGTIVAAMLQPQNPFPPYHGQGRRLSRPGDPLPRVNGVVRIRVYLEPAPAK
jgi:hypothetical protein